MLKHVRGGRYTIHNPAVGVRTFRREEFQAHFTGRLLEISPGSAFATIARARKNTVRRILDVTHGLKRSMVQVVAVAITGSLLSMLVPVIVQVALDSVVPKGDSNLLTVLAAGMFLVSLTVAASEWVHKRIVLNAGSAFFAQLTRNAVGHIFRLPLRYFESRHPGDIATRLESIDHVKTVITGSMVSGAIDIVMLALSGLLMFLYVPALAMMVIAVFGLVICIRLIMYPSMRKQGALALRAKADERSRLLDIVRAVAALKTANATGDTSAKWYDSLVTSVNAEFRSNKIETNALLLVDLATALGTAATLYFGVMAVIGQSITVGMLYAFFTYRGMFFERIDKLVAVMTDVAMLGNNMGRLGDFLEMDQENGGEMLDRSISHAVELREVEFRAGFADRPIIKDIEFSVVPHTGAMIAVQGPSGSGKTTLLKILAGLYEPTGGRMLVDGTAVGRWGMTAYRDNVALLLGSDKLLRGSVTENVTCFSPVPDPSRVEAALRVACLDDAIAALPRQQETLVSEENGVLSSGQRRRLMLARAIYRDAGILLLDEVSSNLDAETTERLLENLRALPATKIITTHDPSVLRHCTSSFDMTGGTLVPRRTMENA